MEKQKFLVPKKGLLVRDPISFTPLPEEGLMVDWNSFWRRRVKREDCSIVQGKELEELLKKKADKKAKEVEEYKKALEEEQKTEPETTSLKRKKRGN